MKYFKSMKKPLLLLFLFCLVPLGISAQSIIKGLVKDVTGEPIIGATVRVVGTQAGTVTDLDGKFSIQASTNSSIRVSYVGYVTQTVALEGRNNITVTLKEDNNTLNDVVVIGYGVQKKSDLTGAVASLKGDEIKNLSTTDAGAALQGKVGGVQIINSGSPGAGAEIRVRGYSSNSGNLSPLLIVDGLKVDNIQYLDPSLIESMEILKDAASAAIYGAQAGNGVVLITTKNGSKGQARVTYSFKAASQSLGKKAELFNAKDYIDYQSYLGYINEDLLSSINYKGQDTDWYDEVFGNSWSFQHNLSVEGGNEKGHFIASLGLVDNDGIVRGDKDTYKRFTGQVNADYRFTKWLKVSSNTSVEKWKRRAVGNGYQSFLNSVVSIDPLTAPYVYSVDDMGKNMGGRWTYGTHWSKHGFVMTPPEYTDEHPVWYGTSKLEEDATGNPLAMRDRLNAINEGVNVRGVVSADITPVSWLTYTSRLGYRISQGNSHDYSTPWYLSSMANSSSYSISANTDASLYYQWENFINYTQDFGKHNVGAMAGMSFRQYNSNGVSANASGPDILKSYEPNFRYLNCVNGNADTTKKIDGVPNMTRAMSYFGRVLYSYDGRYSLQGNFRADAFDSSKLSKDNRWGYFFSGSAGWTFSNEKFFKDNIDPSIMSFGKIRASWGTNGNVNVLGNYSYTAGIATNSQFYNYGPTSAVSYGSMPNGIANPDLTWEKSQQFDLGLDLRFFNDRLSLGIDYYTKTTKDLLVPAPVMPESGFSTMTINAGKVQNKGLEVELTWKDNIGDFRYSVSGNFATLKNEATYLDPSIERIAGATVEGASPGAIRCYFEQGQPVWYMRGYKYAGRDANGGPLYYTKDGGTTNDPGDGDMTNIGSGLPSLTYGITINAEYKGFDLTVFGAGEAGNDIYYGLYRTGYNNIAKGVYDDFKSGKLPEAKSVAGSGTFWRSSAMIYNGSFFKLKQIQLGYTLPTNLTKKVYMQNVRAYVSLDDFFTCTK